MGVTLPLCRDAISVFYSPSRFGYKQRYIERGKLINTGWVWKSTVLVSQEIYSNSKQKATCFPFKIILSSLIHFHILFCHASVHLLKDYYEIPLSSFVTAYLMNSMPLKWVFLMIPLELGEDQRVTRGKFRWIGRLFQDSIVSLVSDNLNTVRFYVQQTFNHLNSQQMITTHHLSYPLNIDLNPAYWGSPAPVVVFHLVLTLFESFLTLKNTFVRFGVIFIDLPKCLKCWYFSRPSPKFQVYLFLGACSWITWKRVVKKSILKKMQWLQKAKITVIDY